MTASVHYPFKTRLAALLVAALIALMPINLLTNLGQPLSVSVGASVAEYQGTSEEYFIYEIDPGGSEENTGARLKVNFSGAWAEKDIFCVPSWTWHEHCNTDRSEDKAACFRVNFNAAQSAFVKVRFWSA